MKQMSPAMAAVIIAVVVIIAAIYGWRTISHSSGPGSNANPYNASGAPTKGGPPPGMGSGQRPGGMSGQGGSAGMMSGPGGSAPASSGP